MTLYHFRSSRKRAVQEFKAGDNPLAILHPEEQKCAEIVALVELDPSTAPTMMIGGTRKWAALHSGAFASRFQELFGYELTSVRKSQLVQNPAWKAYVEELRKGSRDVVMERLRRESLDVAEDYIWSRKQARKQGDYKEARLAAADHLDRIGLTEKPQPTQQQTIIVLKGRTFDAESLMRELPAPSTEEIVVEPEQLESA